MREKLPKGKKRSKQIKVMVTPAEHAEIKMSAESCGYTSSSWLRALALYEMGVAEEDLNAG